MTTKFSISEVRRALLAAIALVALVTLGAYVVKVRRAARNRPPPPAPIPASVTQAAQGFSISKSEGGRILFKAEAKKAVDFRETGKSELEDVEITTYGSTGNRSDHIRSHRCEYDSKAGRIYSEGEVEISLASLPGEAPLAAGAAPSGASALSLQAPMWIKTSGLLFDQNTGLASTNRDLSFRFRQGSGRARGAVYDSRQQTLWLKADVQFSTGQGQPVEVTAAELRYLQRELQIQLQQPELRRQGPGRQRTISAGEGTLFLNEQHEARRAELWGAVHGTAHSPERESEFHADRLELLLDEGQQVRSAAATGNVQVNSRGSAGRSESAAERLDLDFSGPDGALRQSRWQGGVRMTFFPTAPNGQAKTVASEQVELTMKANGEDLEKGRTLAPGRLELSGGGQPRRVLTASLLSIEFGSENQLRKLEGQGNVRTETYRPEPAQGAGRQPASAPALVWPSPQRVTTSDRLVAAFSPATQQIETMEQTGHFHFQEGERQATAQRADSTAADSTTVLAGRPGEDPQVWDKTMRVTARRISLNEKTGDALAEEQVRATRFAQPGEPGLLAGPAKDNEPVHAAADRLLWNRRSGVTRYEAKPGGRVRLWQGHDVLEAKIVEIEPAAGGRQLTASGEVSSVLVEEGQEPLRITAERLIYSDAENRAHYERNVVMKSADLTVAAAALDGFLVPARQVTPGQSRLEHAVATGGVRLNQPARPAVDGHLAVPARRAEAEHADYFPAQEKVVLHGGHPAVYDELRGSTTGRELTYYMADDRLFVVGDDDNARTLTEHRVIKKPR